MHFAGFPFQECFVYLAGNIILHLRFVLKFIAKLKKIVEIREIIHGLFAEIREIILQILLKSDK